MLLLLLALMIGLSACQSPRAPSLQLTDAQQSAMSTVLSQVVLEAADLYADNASLKQAEVEALLKGQDASVRDILKPQEWVEYQTSGRSYFAHRICVDLKRKGRGKASDVAVAPMAGFRTPAVGGHH